MKTSQQLKAMQSFIEKCQAPTSSESWNRILKSILSQKEVWQFLLEEGSPPTPELFASFVSDLFSGLYILKCLGMPTEELIEIETVFIAEIKLFFNSLKQNNFNFDMVTNPTQNGKKEHFTFLLLSRSPIYLSEELLKYYVDELKLNFNVRDQWWLWDNTLLMWLIANACNESAAALLQALEKQSYFKEMINATCNEAATAAIHLLVAKGYRNISADKRSLTLSNLDLLKLLLKSGADINLQTMVSKENVENPTPPEWLGNTALHYACARRDKEFIAFLLENGADPTIKNVQGKTAFDLLLLSPEEARAFVNQISPNNFSDVYREGASALNEIIPLFNTDRENSNSRPSELKTETGKDPEAVSTPRYTKLTQSLFAFSETDSKHKSVIEENSLYCVVS